MEIKWWICAWLAWNIATLLLMGVDKRKAVCHKRRISEAALLWSAFLMGAAGTLAGSRLFRHKTQKTKFRILLPLACVCNAAAALLLWYIRT